MPYHYFKKAAVLLVFIMGYGTLAAQANDTAVQKKAAERHYIFVALSYSSSSGGNRPLTPEEYTVHIKDDSVIAFLPYYGASYSAQINQREGGIRFTSTLFDYSFTEKKKGRCEITVKPKDAKEVQQLFITVFADGAAQLQVMSTNKEATSYSGYFVVK